MSGPDEEQAMRICSVARLENDDDDVVSYAQSQKSSLVYETNAIDEAAPLVLSDTDAVSSHDVPFDFQPNRYYPDMAALSDVSSQSGQKHNVRSLRRFSSKKATSALSYGVHNSAYLEDVTDISDISTEVTGGAAMAVPMAGHGSEPRSSFPEARNDGHGAKKSSRALAFIGIAFCCMTAAGAIVGILFALGLLGGSRSNNESINRSNNGLGPTPTPSILIDFGDFEDTLSPSPPPIDTGGSSPSPIAVATPEPTIGATLAPSDAPTTSPTVFPTFDESLVPSIEATLEPSIGGTLEPSLGDTMEPTVGDNLLPSESATLQPSMGATSTPTTRPSLRPVSLAPTPTPGGGGDIASQIRSLLLPVAGQVIDVANTPQGRAFAALVETWEGPSTIGFSLLPNLTQRYAVLAGVFSLTKVSTLSDLPSGVVTNDANECNWPIITCGPPDSTGFQHVTAFNLFDRPALVTGSIPPELGLVETMETIDLGENAISGSIPEELYNLRELKNIYLHSNRMTGTLSENIKGWPYLEKLYLGYNKFEGPIPQNLGSGAVSNIFGLDIRPLRYLNLNHNKFSGTIPEGLRLRRLYYLDLGFNQLTGQLPDDLATTSVNLRHLYLDNNDLRGEIPESYSSIGNQRLITFVMNNNNLVGDFPTSWGKENDKILTIKVQNNGLTGKIDKDVCKLDVFESNELVELSADCNICSCGKRLCGDCYN